MKRRLGDRFDRCEFVNARIIHEDVESAIFLHGRVDDALDLGRLGDIALHGDRFTAGRRNLVDDLVGAGLAGGVIYND